MIAAEETYGILVIDLAEATFGFLIGSSVKKYSSIRSQVPNKHHHGGMSSLRFERLRDDAINDYFKKVSERCSQAFLGQELKGIIVGGPAKTKGDFISGGYLHHELKKILLEVVDTGHSDEQGLKEAVRAAEGALSSCRFVQEERTLEKFWTESKNGMTVSGMNDTKDRLLRGQVQSLILSEALDLETIQDLKQIADRYATDVLIIGEDEEFGESFNSDVKVGGILRYK